MFVWIFNLIWLKSSVSFCNLKSRQDKVIYKLNYYIIYRQSILINALRKHCLFMGRFVYGVYVSPNVQIFIAVIKISFQFSLHAIQKRSHCKNGIFYTTSSPCHCLWYVDDSVPFVQFKKREKKPFKTPFKKPWKSVTFIKVAGF